MNNKLINNSTKLKNDIKRKYDDNTEFAKEFNSKLKDSPSLYDKVILLKKVKNKMIRLNHFIFYS